MSGGIIQGLRQAALVWLPRAPHDGRGRRVRLVKPFVPCWLDSTLRDVPPDVLREIRRRARGPGGFGTASRVGHVIAFAFCSLVMGAFFVMALRAREYALALIGLPPVFFVYFTVVTALGYRGTKSKAISNWVIMDVFLDAEHCPVCAHSLTGQPVQHDGCIVCSECGAAWRSRSLSEDDSLVEKSGDPAQSPPQGTFMSQTVGGRLWVANGRGRETEIINLSKLKQLFPWSADLSWRDQRRVLRTVPRSLPKVMFYRGMALLMLGLFIGMLDNQIDSIRLNGARSASLMSWGVVLTPFALLIVFVRLSVHGHLERSDLPKIVAGFLAIKRCPKCAHDLAGLPTADDGCTMCAECGAAWRIPTTKIGAA